MSDECKYYYYDNGYSCSLKYEKEGRSSVDSDYVHSFCWGYNYERCALYKKYASSDGCYLTSACTESRGLADDCHELQVLRDFRDNYLKNLECGDKEIADYYCFAPQIVDKIKERPDAREIFDKIYSEFVAPCVRFIENGEKESAHTLYRAYALNLKETYL